MRFARAARPPLPPAGKITPTERLVRRASRSLALVTLALIAGLLAAVGVTTAAVAIGMSDQTVDQNLEAAVHSRIEALRNLTVEGPKQEDEDAISTESPEDEPRTETDGEADDGELPGAVQTPGATVPPTPGPTASSGAGLFDPDEAQLESADTFFLVLDRNGALLSSSTPSVPSGLPDRAAATAAGANAHGDDLRSITVDGVHVRLMTEAVIDRTGTVVAYLQAGFVLTQHDQQNNAILVTVLLTSLTGLLGAALVTLLVTSRAMVPIRTAFAAERRFVAAASHELRTPVAVVRASAELLQREGLVSDQGKPLVDDIVAESDRLGRLVGDLLALASAEAGAIDLNTAPLELRSFVADLARRAETIGATRGVRVEVVQEDERADPELLVEADRDRMTQLLLIFIDNAIDHSPPGGTVRLAVAPMTESGRALVAVRVADEGPGVPAHERVRIFEPFARLAGRRRQTGNTGLGLAIARILAARQEATLHVDDAVGGGAVFSVWLPRRQGTGATAGA